MAVYNVRMLAFHDEHTIRKVTVPDKTPDDGVLEVIFHYGQNDFQPQPGICSVSVGDVVELPKGNFVVMPCGFRPLTESEYADLKAAPRLDRHDLVWDWDEKS